MEQTGSIREREREREIKGEWEAERGDGLYTWEMTFDLHLLRNFEKGGSRMFGTAEQPEHRWGRRWNHALSGDERTPDPGHRSDSFSTGLLLCVCTVSQLSIAQNLGIAKKKKRVYEGDTKRGTYIIAIVVLILILLPHILVIIEPDILPLCQFFVIFQ